MNDYLIAVTSFVSKILKHVVEFREKKKLCFVMKMFLLPNF